MGYVKSIYMGLDLGTSKIKAGILDKEVSMKTLMNAPAPLVHVKGLNCESDAMAYVDQVRQLLAQLLSKTDKEPVLGISSQRSSFVLWDPSTGKPVTPLISWMDRRAQTFCRQAHATQSWIEKVTGLMLSPHYAGPKLATLFKEDPQLLKKARAGKILFGTLETFLIWHLTEGQAHVTDLSMAARTLLVDVAQGGFSDQLIDFFNVPKDILPLIIPSFNQRIPIKIGEKHKGYISAIIADQAAALYCAMQVSKFAVLVNLGTGGFVSMCTGQDLKQPDHYLAGPILANNQYNIWYAMEGTINGIGPEYAALTDINMDVQSQDPFPGSFCIPDAKGIGTPYWRADIKQLFSDDVAHLDSIKKKQVFLEGIVFRVTQILKAIQKHAKPKQIVLSGGLSKDPFLCRAIAITTGLDVVKLDTDELSLLGISMLASQGMTPCAMASEKVKINDNTGTYLPDKYKQWQTWADKILATELKLHFNPNDLNI